MQGWEVRVDTGQGGLQHADAFPVPVPGQVKLVHSVALVIGDSSISLCVDGCYQ